MRLHRTGRQQRSIALRYRLGLAVAFLLAAALAAGSVQAESIFPSDPPPLTTLVKFEDRKYEIAYSEEVSLEPVATNIVRKVGYGSVSTISVATTATGTYSVDGLTSPHVSYPGIEVSEIPRYRPFWYGGGPSFSIQSLGRSSNGGLVRTNSNSYGVRSCLTRGSIVSCFRTY